MIDWISIELDTRGPQSIQWDTPYFNEAEIHIFQITGNGRSYRKRGDEIKHTNVIIILLEYFSISQYLIKYMETQTTK